MIQDRNALKRKIKIFAVDTFAVAAALPLAMMVRYDTVDMAMRKIMTATFLEVWAIGLGIKVTFLYFSRLYRGIWSYTSTKDLITIFKTSFSAVGAALLVFFLWNRGHSLPRSMFFIEGAICLLLLGGMRFAWRLWRERQALSLKENPERTLIVGLGGATEQLIRELRKAFADKVKIVGILDEGNEHHGRTIHGVRVFGNTSVLAEVAKMTGATQVFVTLPAASYKGLGALNDLCQREALKVKILPPTTDVMDGRVQISHLRPIELNDLLGRAPIQLDTAELGRMIHGATVLITGAGGSIGSELCNQVMQFQPRKLVLFEMCEFNLYKVEIDLLERYPGIDIVAVLGDIRERPRVAEVMETHLPDIVFHAAAYKHVPLIEKNPLEAVKTNILGSKIVAEEALRSGVGRFVMISSDKAVNPTNVMGTTKRIAEMICQNLNRKNQTKFLIIRFGNVLGSAGSVIPRFMTQIAQGGPVTVTHPEITRFFMSIPEAAQLVLQASACGVGGEIFVLDMGDPVRIVDLACNLIRLSGLVPDEDIKIEFVGLRPGEKLYEEVLATDENSLPTRHPLVRVAKARDIPQDFERYLHRILERISDPDAKPDKTFFNALVPEYEPIGEKH